MSQRYLTVYVHSLTYDLSAPPTVFFSSWVPCILELHHYPASQTPGNYSDFDPIHPYIQSTLFKIVVAILGGNGKKQQPLSYPGHHSVYHRLTWPMATDLSPVLIFSNWLHTAYLYRRPQKILGNAICLYHLSSKILDCL